MKNLTFKAAALNDGRPTVNRRSTDGQSQRRYSLTPITKRWRALMMVVFLFTLGIGQMWADLTAHVPGVYEKTVATGGYGCTLTTVASGENAGTFEVYYFSAQSKYSENTSVYNGGTKQQYRLMCTDSDSEYQLINRNGTGTFTASCDWIEMAYSTTGFSKSDYTFGSTTFNEFFEITPNGGNTGITKTCYIKPKEGDVLTLKVSGYVEFAILGSDNGSSKYMTVAVDGGTPTSWKSNTLSRRSVTFTTEEHTIVVANVGTSANAFYGFSLKLPSCDDANASIIANTSIYVNDELDLEFSSDNTNSVVYDIKKGGSATSDASVTAGVFKATVAGTYVVTATQAMDASNHCAVEESVTITVNSKTPVSSVSISGDATAYIGIAKTLTATADQAVSEYKWEVDGVDQGVNAASFNFSAAAAGTYSVVCKARNSFNDPGEYIASSAHSLTVTSLYGELIRATLTGGNNATMTGIIGGTFDSNLGSGKYKLDKNVYMGVQLASGSFQEGDTVIVSMTTAGSNYPCLFADKERNTLLYLATETSSALVYKMVLPAAANNKNTVYLSRDNDVTYKWNPVVAYISVVRPMPVKSTAYDLTAVKINGTPISAANLAVLKTADAYLLDLATEYPEGPTVKFARQTTNTYEDDSQKVLNDTITVTATEVSSKWQAQATIGTITYTVKMAKSAATAKVYYYDGATKLGEETVAINGNPVEAGDYDDKTLASFVGWYNNSDLAEEHKIANIAELVVTADVNVYGKWTNQYATSANIEQWVLDNSTKYDAVAQLGTLKYASNITNSLDTLNDDPSKDNRNYAYLGLKIKASGKMLDFRLANGQTVKVKLGATGNYPQVALNGGDYAAMSLTDNVWTYTAEGADAYISIKTPNTNTVVIKQVMINEDIAAVTLPWRVTYDANGGTCGTAEAIWKGSALVLPDVTPAVPADYTFAGWYDEATGGVLVGAAGASYTPTDNTTLFAHFAPVEYTINYNEGEHGQTAIVVASAGWGTEYTAIANPFTPETGYIFAGWAVSGVDGVSTIAAGGSFTMPKNEVTLTALWEDNSKVAVIVETNVKYESLAEAIAFAEAGQTIQLLQNIEQANGVAIAKNLTLDLNGKIFTCTSGSNVNSRAIKITAGNVTIQNGSIIAVPTANFEGGCYGPIRIEGATTNVTLEDLTLQNGRHYGLGIKLVEGYLRMEDCTVISENGGGGLEVGEATADVINCTFTQTGLDNAHAWISTCLATCDNGVLNVQGGTYTSEHYSMYVYTSGGEMNVESGSFTGDVVNKVTPSSYPDAVGTINITGGTFEGVGEEPIHFTTDNTGKTSIAISGGSFDAPVENEYCAPGYVPSAEVAPGVYTVVPKDGVEIIGVVVTGNTTGDVSGLYQGTATVNLNSKKIDSGKYIYVTLKEGYTFEENDVLIVDVNTKASIGTKALEITTGVGNIDGAVWKTIAFDDYATGDNIISLEGIAANQTSIGLKRSDNQNAKINGLRVLRPMKPMLTAITIDGRDGVINEAAKTVAVTIPHEADLAALTVVPTIVWNEAAATNSIVVNDGSAWIEGANTYKLTDKDGDYTVYTITLTRDVLKHTVSFNTHGGTAVASEEVVHGEYLAAGQVPADPTKEDYIFQYWSETEDGTEVDVTTVQINADKEFHAVWAADGAIKLLSGATVNHTNFITGVTADETVEFQGNTVNYAKFSGTVSGVNGVKDLTRVIAYNATTNKTKIQISAHNNSTSARNILVKGLVEGADAAVDLATIALGNKEDKVSDWIEFDNAANRTIYIMVSSSAGDVYFTQVKVIESGETPMKQAGEAGYSLNLNKGRFFGTASTDLAFEGLNARLSGDYTALNSGYAKLNSTSMSFTVASAMTLSVTTNNNKTYYVTKGAAGTDNETAKTGVSEFDLTAGTWYITAGAAEVQFTNIAFTAPKCEEPTITPMSNSDLCEGDDFAALTVSASVSDGGDLHYQWYKEAGADDEAVGTDAASYTPEADGQYYVVVTNQLDGYSNNSATSNTITVAHFAAAVITTAPLNQRGEVDDVVTLTVAATGKNVSYKWYTCDEDGSNEVALDPEQTEASLNVTVTAGMSQWYKVIVTSDCGNAEAKAKVSEFQPTTPANVENSILWDWTSSAWPASGSAAFTNEDAPDYELLADADAIVPNAEGFRSDMLYGKGQYVWRYNNQFFQGSAIKFTSTVAGKVRVYFRSTGGGKTVNVAINGTAAGSRTNSFGWSSYVEVPAGEVEILCSGDGYTRIQQIEFLALAHQRTSGYAAGDLGTVILEDATIIEGANLYQLAGLNENGYLAFDEILSGELEAGKPYLFEVTNPSNISFYKPVGADHSDDEIAHKGMIGTFAGTTLYQGSDNYYYFSGRHIWKVNDFTVAIPIPAHRCYVDMDVLQSAGPAQQQAPGRRRVTLGVQGTQVATGIEDVDASEKPVKLLINGQMYILRGEKLFDATGRLVK